MFPVSDRYELEIDEDLRHQQKVWVIERICWLLMALLMLAALLGLLGHGPLSNRTLTDPVSGLVIQYHRFERANAETAIEIHLSPSDQPTSQTQLQIGQAFLANVEMMRFEPEPAEVDLRPGYNTYRFNRPDPAGHADIVLHYKPLNAGDVDVAMGLIEYPALTFSQFIYP